MSLRQLCPRQCRSSRFGAALVLGVVCTGSVMSGCSLKYDYTVVKKSDDLCLPCVADARTLVVLSTEGVDLSSLSPMIGDPNAYEAYVLARMRQCMSGRFTAQRVWQGEMRDWMQSHFVYADSGSLQVAARSCVEFTQGRHGLTDATISDSAGLKALLEEQGCGYILFLEDLVAGSTFGVSAVPDASGPFVGVVPIGTDYVNLEYPVIRGQFFLFSADGSDLLYQAYVMGNTATKTGSGYGDHVLSFAGQMVRGALRVR